ncbi:MAG: hypothetical protein ABGW87_07625 [Sphingomonadaceae bacterium]
MTIESTSSEGPLARILDSLRELERSAASELALIEEKLPELQRQARAKPKRRGGKGSIDAAKYQLGSVLTLCGFEGTDDLVLLGFLACGDRALQWMAEARLAFGPMTFAELVRAALADPQRTAWCRKWGEYRRKVYKKAAYDQSVTSFLESGKTGPRQRWRRAEITAEQHDIIEDICTALGRPKPTLSNRGQAFDWIFKNGGNPNFWVPPVEPNEWEKQ